MVGRLRTYFTQVNLTSRPQMASTIATSLSNEVHSALWRLCLPQSTWEDPEALAQVLVQQYGDTKTPAAYLLSFQTAKQTDRQTTVQFFDELFGYCVKAFPELTRGLDQNVNKEEFESRLHAVFTSRYVHGLRDANVKRMLLYFPSASLHNLKVRARDLELTEQVALDKMPPAASNTAQSSTQQDGRPNTSSSASNQKQDERKQHTRAQSSTTGHNGRLTCSFCKKPNHTADVCRARLAEQQHSHSQQQPLQQQPQLRQQYAQRGASTYQPYRQQQQQQQPQVQPSTSRPPPQCFRCGHVGHLIGNCRARFHTDGTQLQLISQASTTSAAPSTAAPAQFGKQTPALNSRESSAKSPSAALRPLWWHSSADA